MLCTTSINSLANTKNKLHIQSDLHYVYKQKIYHDKQKETDNIFDEYHPTLLKDIDNPTLIKERKLNIDSDAYAKI